MHYSTRRTVDKSRSLPDLVTLGVDDNVVYPALLLIFSLHRAKTPRLEVQVGYFTGHLSLPNQRAIMSVASGLGIDLSLREFAFDKDLFVGKRHITPTTFLKFLFADLLLDPFLWLDVDTIVLPGWELIFERLAEAESTTELLVARKANIQATEFNAGVLGWPRRLVRREWRQQVSSKSAEGFSLEQDIFNALYKDALEWVPPGFNFVALWEDLVDQLPGDLSVLHYAGPLKPWFLKEHHKNSCKKAKCLWAQWFEFEEQAFLSPELSDSLDTLKRLKDESLTSYSEYVGKLPFFRLVKLADTRLSFFLVQQAAHVLEAFGKFSFQNSHPFHGRPKALSK